MEVLSPTSGDANGVQPVEAAARAAPPTGLPARGAQAGANAPSVSLPLRFVLTGMLSLFAGVIWLALRPDILATYHYNQYVIAVTHLLTLGWITSVVMGAMYQLVPVALETRLHSERLGRWHFVLHLVGFAGMVWMFWIWNMKQVGHFGSVLALGVGLFVYNLARTLKNIPRWNVIAVAIASALFWLSATVLVGLAIATAKSTYELADHLETTSLLGAMINSLKALAGFMARFDAIATMHAHAHLGAVGVFLILIVGVSYKLVPMFTLSEIQSQRRAAWSIGLLNAGLLGCFLSILLRSPLKPAFALVVIGGLVVYGCELRAILRARKRRVLDWGLRYFLTALSLSIPLGALALVLSWPGLPLNPFTGQLENVYGLLALLGVVSLAILGMLYKIVPFLVWYSSYSREIGRSKVPALADLYSAQLQAISYWLYVAGLLALSVSTILSNATAVRGSCLLLVASLAIFALNMGGILKHLFRPKIEPLMFPPQPLARRSS